tara:strand:+ start:106 stop:624 length:519 start_codon:yes stop_codon:yes gene_type:complete
MKCKNCKDEFKPKQFNRKYCTKDECNDLYFEFLKSQYFKKLNKDKKEKKKKLETVQDLLKSTQIVFNKYIRKRDKGQPCISCNNPTPKKVNAGHYIASGKSKFLTFNEDNVHLQCEYCNTHLHGNLLDYRINLIEKIGEDKVEYLEENRHITKKYLRSELLAITEKYKKLLK